MSSPDCKRQKLADDVNSVAKMSKVSPTKNVETQTENGRSTASTSKKPTPIKRNAQMFEEVAKSSGFVDRTMLIKELLEGTEVDVDTYVMIFAPSKFGKTLNLGMIRLFCDIADKNRTTKEDVAKDPTMEDLRSNPSKNMKVFRRQFEGTKYEECLILKEKEFVIQHFGRHPVVLFNFKSCRPENRSEAKICCARLVHKAYLENSYLQNSKELQSPNPKITNIKGICTAWMNYKDVHLKSLSMDEVIGGLENLIRSLRIHWGRKPVFLVDEVDRPCVHAMECKLSEDQVREIGTTITDVICSIVKSEDEQLKLEAALVTGICKFVNSGLSGMDNTMPVYFLSDDRFSEYYGLTAQEVKTLVERLYGSQGDAKKINKIINGINARYNGYYQHPFSGDKEKDARYCLFSVLNYMQNTNPKKLYFWSDGGFLTQKLVAVLRKSPKIMNAIHVLLYKDSGTIEIKYQEAVNVEHILGLYREEMDPDPNEVFNFFLQRGYLAYNLEKPIEQESIEEESIEEESIEEESIEEESIEEESIEEERVKINLRIPNLEIKELYKTMFQEYYRNLDENIQSKLTDCGKIFKSLHTQDSTNFQKDLNELCEYLKCIFQFMQCTNERTICSHIVAILQHYAGYEKGEVDYAVKYFDDERKQKVVYIDVWGRHGNSVIIIEVKFNSEATSEPGKIGCKTKSSLAAAEDVVRLLPGKKEPEGGFGGKAGTGRDLEVLTSKIKKYTIIGMAVDGDYTTHMLVFRDTYDWKNVIQVNPENYVAELISTHLNSETPVV